MKLLRDLYCYFFHSRHHLVIEDSGLPRPLNITSYTWWCPRCDKGGRPRPAVVLAAGLGMAALMAGCSPSPLPTLARPACADKVALAFTSRVPVRGAFSCVVMRFGRELSQLGINSDDEWAATNRAIEARRPLQYETRLKSGAYVYSDRAGHTLLVWVDRNGVESMDLTGP